MRWLLSSDSGHWILKQPFTEIGLFIIAWISSFLLSIQGINLGDMGYHLTNQYFLIEDFQKYLFTDSQYVVLTNVIGGAWLHLYPSPSLLWVYCGGSLLYALTIVITFKTLCLILHEAEQYLIGIVVFCCSLILLVTSAISEYINYFTLPALLIAGFFYIFVYLSGKPAKTENRPVLCLFLGAMLTLIILSRLNLAIFVLFIVLFLLFIFFVLKDASYFSGKDLLLIGAGFVLTGFIFLLILSLLDVNLLHLLSNPIPVGRERSHSLGILFENYQTDILNIAGYSSACAVGIYALRTTKRPAPYYYYTSLVLFIISLGVTLVSFEWEAVYQILNYSQIIFLSAGFTIGITVILGMFLLFPERFSHGSDPTSGKETSVHIQVDSTEKGRTVTLRIFSLLILSSVLALIGCIGSGSGLLKVIYGLFFPFSLAFMLFITWVQVDIRARTDPGKCRECDRIIPSRLLFIGVLLVVALFTASHYSFADAPRTQLTTSFDHPSLFPTLSTPKRVEVMDSLMSELDRLEIRNKKVLFLNSIPIFYYLTQTEPVYYRFPFPLIRTEQIVFEAQQEIEENDCLPEYVIVSINYTNNTWPSTSIRHILIDDLEKRYRHDLHYLKIWQNDAFIIYRRPQ